MTRFATIYSVVATAALAFMLGRELAPTHGLDADPAAVDLLLPQGRRPRARSTTGTTEPGHRDDRRADTVPAHSTPGRSPRATTASWP
ncbi:MAG: hypothetical protein R3F30_12655 [Planctomycetota bacterium]